MFNQRHFELNIAGCGNVSAYGLNSESLYRSSLEAIPLPKSSLSRHVGEQVYTYDTHPVELKSLKPFLPKHPRLRRSSNVTKFGMVAALQALGEERLAKVQNMELSIGIVVTFLNGCVNYSNKLYTEILEDPAVASPILFPETVYNAPASHLASYLNSQGPTYSLIGDSAAFFSGLKVAHDWIELGLVDGCLVVSAEELDWLSCEGLNLCSDKLVGTEGAAAIYVDKESEGVKLDVHGPFDYRNSEEQKVAMREAFSFLQNKEESFLVDGLSGVKALDREEEKLLETWKGRSLSILPNLGCPMAVTGGFQLAAAMGAIEDGNDLSSVYSRGSNQHAFSATLRKV